MGVAGLPEGTGEEVHCDKEQHSELDDPDPRWSHVQHSRQQAVAALFGSGGSSLLGTSGGMGNWLSKMTEFEWGECGEGGVEGVTECAGCCSAAVSNIVLYNRQP